MKGIDMDVIEKIRQLVALMAEQDLAELEVEEPELRIKIKASQPAQYAAPSILGPQQLEGQPQPYALQEAAEVAAATPPAREEGLLEIASPMVGTFYRAPAEGAESYVTVGTVVEPDTVVCLVEAMKVMNEVKAELSGEIVEILLQNAEPVEYGQPLFLVRPHEE